jgi:hypothetical protein
MVQRDHPAPVHLAHQPCVDPVLRPLAALQPIAADQLRRVGREHLDPDVPEMEPAAPGRVAAIIADVMVERALPVALEAAARDEHHAGILEVRHVAAEIAAVPRRFHAGDHLPDRALLGGGIGGRRAGAGGEQEGEGKGRELHAAS